jgi:hypothetical protein
MVDKLLVGGRKAQSTTYHCNKMKALKYMLRKYKYPLLYERSTKKNTMVFMKRLCCLLRIREKEKRFSLHCWDWLCYQILNINTSISAVQNVFSKSMQMALGKPKKRRCVDVYVMHAPEQ